MESAETRYGYLANQVKGWDNEFERLQEFTGMDQKFEPGAQGIVDEITERFKEKERANTSLLRYLHEQQAEIREIESQTRKHSLKAQTLTEVLDDATADGGAAGGGLDGLRVAATADDESSAAVEERLEGCCRSVTATLRSLWAEGDDGSVRRARTSAR